MNFNQSVLLGRITNIDELKNNPASDSLKFSMATNRSYKDASGEKREDAQFHTIVCFNQSAKFISEFGKVGNLVLVEGRIQSGKYIDKEGAEKYYTEIVADKVELQPKNLQKTETEF